MEKTLLALTGFTLQFHTIENQSVSQEKMRQVASTPYFWKSALKASLLSHLITNLLYLLATKPLQRKQTRPIMFIQIIHTNTKWQTGKFSNLTAYLFPHLKKEIVKVLPQVAGNIILRCHHLLVKNCSPCIRNISPNRHSSLWRHLGTWRGMLWTTYLFGRLKGRLGLQLEESADTLNRAQRAISQHCTRLPLMLLFKEFSWVDAWSTLSQHLLPWWLHSHSQGFLAVRHKPWVTLGGQRWKYYSFQSHPILAVIPLSILYICT